jgi:hypothetical protein
MYTMEYYSTIKKNEILFQEKWMKLEDIMFSKISQAQKDKYQFSFNMWKIKFF